MVNKLKIVQWNTTDRNHSDGKKSNRRIEKGKEGTSKLLGSNIKTERLLSRDSQVLTVTISLLKPVGVAGSVTCAAW